MKSQVEPQFDNTDILAPASALQSLTGRVIEGLNLTDPTVLLGLKKGKVSANVPLNISSRTIRECYNRILRRLSIHPEGSPSIPTIIEEFEVATVTAYRTKSHYIFYIEAIINSFLNNYTLDMSVQAFGYELHLKKDADTKLLTQEEEYTLAFDNVLRFHPLYVAYLYGVSGDVAKEQTIIEEACAQLRWFLKRAIQRHEV